MRGHHGRQRRAQTHLAERHPGTGARPFIDVSRTLLGIAPDHISQRRDDQRVSVESGAAEAVLERPRRKRATRSRYARNRVRHQPRVLLLRFSRVRPRAHARRQPGRRRARAPRARAHSLEALTLASGQGVSAAQAPPSLAFGSRGTTSGAQPELRLESVQPPFHRHSHGNGARYGSAGCTLLQSFGDAVDALE